MSGAMSSAVAHPSMTAYVLTNYLWDCMEDYPEDLPEILHALKHEGPDQFKLKAEYFFELKRGLPPRLSPYATLLFSIEQKDFSLFLTQCPALKIDEELLLIHEEVLSEENKIKILEVLFSDLISQWETKKAESECFKKLETPEHEDSKALSVLLAAERDDEPFKDGSSLITELHQRFKWIHQYFKLPAGASRDAALDLSSEEIAEDQKFKNFSEMHENLKLDHPLVKKLGQVLLPDLKIKTSQKDAAKILNALKQWIDHVYVNATHSLWHNFRPENYALYFLWHREHKLNLIQVICASYCQEAPPSSPKSFVKKSATASVVWEHLSAEAGAGSSGMSALTPAEAGVQ